MAIIVSLYIDCILRKNLEMAYMEQSKKAAQLMETSFDLIDDDQMQIAQSKEQYIDEQYKERSQQAIVQLFRFLQAKDVFI